MTASRLIELAERVEQASGPDRELDALIWCALRGVKYVAWYDCYGSDAGRLTQVGFREPPRRTELVSNGRNIPHARPVTASLDAAMSLVPEGWHLRDLGECRFMTRGPFGASVEIWGTAEAPDGSAVHITPSRKHGVAATPALALTAACLRALAQGETNNAG